MNTNRLVRLATKQGYLPCARLLNLTQKIRLHLHMASEDCVHANENTEFFAWVSRIRTLQPTGREYYESGIPENDQLHTHQIDSCLDDEHSVPMIWIGCMVRPFFSAQGVSLLSKAMWTPYCTPLGSRTREQKVIHKQHSTVGPQWREPGSNGNHVKPCVAAQGV